MTRPIPLGLLAALLFAALYNISFRLAPAVTSGRVAILILLALYAGSLRHAWRQTLGPSQPQIACLILVTLYAAAQFVLEGSDVTQLSRLVNFGFYVLLGAPLFAVASGHSLRRFLQAMVLATSAQALFIAISFVSPGYRAFLADILVQGGNIPLTAALQVPGFSNSAGALLSLTQGLGVFAALLAARLAPRRGTRRAYFMLAVACMLSIIVVGRTGLQLSIGLFVAYFVLAGPVALGRAIVTSVLLAVALTSGGAYFLTTISARNPESARTLEWAFEFFLKGRQGTFFREFLGEQTIPPLTVGTLVGTGRVAAEDGIANASGSDSGYVQTYYALGLPAAMIFYGAFFTLAIARLAQVRTEVITLALLVAVTALLEVKEPFIFKYALPFVLLVLLSLAGHADIQAPQAAIKR